MAGKQQESDMRLFAAVLVVLVVVVAAFIFALGATRAPEAFTQVWLESGNPEQAAAGESLNVRFTIDSHETGQTTYSYKIMAEGAEKAAGSATLAPGEQKTIVESISISAAGTQRVDIEITKPEKPEPYTLWFWVEAS